MIVTRFLKILQENFFFSENVILVWESARMLNFDGMNHLKKKEPNELLAHAITTERDFPITKCV